MFYAIPEMHTRDGQQVNAIFGVAKFLKSLADENSDASIIVVSDTWKSFRSQLFTAYKWTRDRMPDDLRSQIEGIFSLFDAANIVNLSQNWYEADDIIGSLVTQYKDKKAQLIIISSDKDLCQFVEDGRVHIYDAMKRQFIKENDVIKKFGVPTKKVADYLAIVGDTSDNIPWIRWFGPKKAASLLDTYDSIEEIYDNIDALTPKMQQILEEEKENAFISKKLATIVTDLVIDDVPQSPLSENIKQDSYMELLKKYEFRSLIPADKLEIVKKIELKPKEIKTLKEIISLKEALLAKKSPISVAVGIQSRLIIMDEMDIYSIDPSVIDVSELIDIFLKNSVNIAGYDVKNFLRTLYTIKNPPEKTMEEQGRLF